MKNRYHLRKFVKPLLLRHEMPNGVIVWSGIMPRFYYQDGDKREAVRITDKEKHLNEKKKVS